jgi:hypothetical protein
MIQPLNAQGAFFDNALLLIVLARLIRAGIQAVLATGTAILIHDYDSVCPPETGAGRAALDTGSASAVHAKNRDKIGAQAGVFSNRPKAQYPVPLLSQRQVVLILARNGAGIAPDTHPQID